MSFIDSEILSLRSKAILSMGLERTSCAVFKKVLGDF